MKDKTIYFKVVFSIFMKTRSLFATILFMVIAFFMTLPVYAKEQSEPDVYQVEQMTWTEIKEIKFSDYDMADALIRGLSRVEAIYPNDTYGGYGYVVTTADTFEIQYPICMTIAEKFMEETVIDIAVSCRKSGTKYCSVDIKYNKREGDTITIGDEYNLDYGCYYYESAWNWGSGDSTH